MSQALLTVSYRRSPQLQDTMGWGRNIMTDSKQTMTVMAGEAWNITLAGIKVAAEKGHCQLRGAVVVLEPSRGDTVFVASINSKTTVPLRHSLLVFTEQLAQRNYGRTYMLAAGTTISDEDHRGLLVTARASNYRGGIIAVCMSENDWPVAQMAAETMAAAMQMQFDKQAINATGDGFE